MAALALTLLVMGLTAAGMLYLQQVQLLRAVDVTLQESIDEVSADLHAEPDARRRQLPEGVSDDDQHTAENDEAMLTFLVAQSRGSFQLLDGDGHILAASRQLEGEPPLHDADEWSEEHTNRDGPSVIRVNESGYRIAATRMGNDLILVAAYSLDEMERSLRFQTSALFVVIPLLSGLVGALIWQVMGRALKPVEAIRSEVASISGRDLDRRVSVPDTSVELASLAATMNDMLDRLDRSAQQQSRFVSDAAHELRSPLTGLRGQLEVNIHHPDAPGRVEAERSMLAEAVRMQSLVDDLLLLARSDRTGTAARANIELDLDDIVLDEADNLGRRRADLTVRRNGVSAAQVRGDSDQLQRVVRNLADNAARHAATAVSFELGESGSSVWLAVVDDGPGIPPSEAEAIFDRFTRLDESRNRDAGGSGLGLAICREIVESHGGSIRLDTAHSPGARFVVEIPIVGLQD